MWSLNYTRVIAERFGDQLGIIKRYRNGLFTLLYLVTRGHFRSPDKSGGHTIRSVMVENPMLHANFMALGFIERELLLIEVWHCGNRNCLPFWLLWPWPDDLHTNLTRIPWRYTRCAKMNFMLPLFRKLSSDRQTDRQTVRTAIMYHAASRVVKDNKLTVDLLLYRFLKVNNARVEIVRI